MNKRYTLLLLLVVYILPFTSISIQAQATQPVARFSNMLPDDDLFLVFYLDDQPIVRENQPRILSSQWGTPYLSVETGTYDLSIRNVDTGEIIAIQEDVLFEEGTIYTALAWQSITADTPEILLIDETDALSETDVTSSGFVTLLLDINIPLNVEYRFDGQAVEVNTAGATVFPVTAGEHVIEVRINGEQLNGYADAAYAIFPETEVDLFVDMFESMLNVDINDDTTEYVLQAPFTMSTNQSILMVAQMSASLDSMIQSVDNALFASQVDFIYGLGVEPQGSVTVEDEITGTLSSAGLRHSYEFTPSETREYVISLDDASPSPGEDVSTFISNLLNTAYDPYLLVLEGDTLVDFTNSIVDEDGFLIDARAEMTITLTAGVTYTIQAASAADTSAGEYVLSLR